MTCNCFDRLSTPSRKLMMTMQYILSLSKDLAMCLQLMLMLQPWKETSALLQKSRSAKASDTLQSGIKNITVSEPIHPEFIEGLLTFNKLTI